MSAFETAIIDMDADLFDAFGEDATFQRGIGAPVPVRVVVTRGVQKFGDYGQVVARVTTISVRNSEWIPQLGDVLVLTSGTREIEALDSDDGFVSVAVLNG